MVELLKGAWAGLGERGRVALLIVVAIVAITLTALGFDIMRFFPQ